MILLHAVEGGVIKTPDFNTLFRKLLFRIFEAHGVVQIIQRMNGIFDRKNLVVRETPGNKCGPVPFVCTYGKAEIAAALYSL